MTRMSRRQLLRRALVGGSGLLAAYAVGCGGEDERSEPTASPEVTATGAPGTLTATPGPTSGVMRWRRIEATGALPPVRRDHSLITDGLKLVLVFGGRNDTGTLGDEWAYEFPDGI